MRRDQRRLAKANAAKAFGIAALTTAVGVAVLPAYTVKPAGHLTLSVHATAVTIRLRQSRSWDTLHGVRIESATLTSFDALHLGLVMPCSPAGCDNTDRPRTLNVTATGPLARLTINADHINDLSFGEGSDIRVNWDRDEPQRVTIATDHARASGEVSVTGSATVRCSDCGPAVSGNSPDASLSQRYISPTGSVVMGFEGTVAGTSISLLLPRDADMPLSFTDQVQSIHFVSADVPSEPICTIQEGTAEIDGRSEPHVVLDEHHCVALDVGSQFSGRIETSHKGLTLTGSGSADALYIGDASQVENALPTIQQRLSASPLVQSYRHIVVFLVSFLIPYLGLSLRKQK